MPSPVLFDDVRTTVRQWRWPREFRIPAAEWPADVLAAFADLSGGAEPAGPAAGSAGSAGPAASPWRSIADVATGIWRLRNRIALRPGEMSRSTIRHIERAWDAFAAAGVEIRDHLGEPFDSGLSIRAVAFMPTPGLHRQCVIETVRPSVYLNDRVIQVAEVIVGTPKGLAEADRGANERRA